MVRVKICGLTNLDDALAAAGFGADALGFVFAASPRRVTPEKVREIVDRLPPLVMTVGVFVDETPERVREIRDACRLDVVQLHGDETEDHIQAVGGRVIKAWKISRKAPEFKRAYPAATLLLDTYSPHQAGGSGQTFDWRLAVEAARTRPVILAGGLSPDNVKEAVATVKPYAVDVSSGVESTFGRKDHVKLRSFIKAAKSLD